MKQNLPQRKNIRIKGYNYSNQGYYFITICTQNRECILSKIIENIKNDEKHIGVGVLDDPKIENAKIELLKAGDIVKKQIKMMNSIYENMQIIDYVIMPNHIHFILEIMQTYNKNRVVGDADPYKYEITVFNIYIKENNKSKIWKNNLAT